MKLTRTAKKIRDIVRGLDMECPDYIRIRRTYAGKWMLHSGMWSWYALDEEGMELFGSQWTCREIIKAKKLRLYTHPFFFATEIIVENRRTS